MDFFFVVSRWLAGLVFSLGMLVAAATAEGLYANTRRWGGRKNALDVVDGGFAFYYFSLFFNGSSGASWGALMKSFDLVGHSKLQGFINAF